ncbi:glycosyltransferase family 4 protein [Clostridium gasigenes]|uniref:glycosyltransferase family 4 protein n=1 Tax=Clostridium gasigenes TaxID=94869 RepID=UPI001C0DFF9C|nr:glycosyltransferase family 1 protein [Clostridium gasigenes]MBU3103154.1 glycosyltransferase family 4 protein [Clostridium gasigenes]
MKIGIDARPLIEKKTGVGYYLKYLLDNILENDKANEYYLFSDREVFYNAGKYSNLNVIIDTESKMKKTFWYLFNTRKLCEKYSIDVFWGTQHVLPLNMKAIKTVLTIHDLVAFDFKETMGTYNRIINRVLIPRSLKKADKIIAVSKSTKERLYYNFPNLSKDKSKVIYEDVVVNNNFNNINDDILNKNSIKEKEYLMFLGTIEPRKNIKTLIKALEGINKETGMKLVICGKYGWKCSEEKLLIEANKDKIVFLNYVTEEEKNYLMKYSFAFVFPSLYEGFGLPVLEAMRSGTISIVSDNTSLKELIEKEELKFKTEDYKELEKKVISLYNNKKLYDEARKYCGEREKYFSWDNISKEYIHELTKW